MASASSSFFLRVLDPPASLGSGAVPSDKASIGDLKAAFGGNASPKLTDYYAGGAFVPNPPPTSAWQKAPIPTSGTISLGMFLGVSLAYTGTITYPDITIQGWWWISLPKAPNGWNTTNLNGKLIGAGAGGGGGGGWGNPKSDPYCSGGGGGAGYENNFNTTDIQMGGWFNVYIGIGGGGGAPTNYWTGNANTAKAGDGSYGENSIFRLYPKSSPTAFYTQVASGGTPGWGGAAYIALSSAGGPCPGGSQDGQPGWGSRQGSGFASMPGGRGGNSSVGLGGAGGAVRDNGQNGQGPGAGGGGGAGYMDNSDYGYGGWGGAGYGGFARITLSKAT